MAKKLPVASLQELYKRCPPNQAKQFDRFRNKTAEYNMRLHKNPAYLPKIDWNYYRTNVRGDFVKMVDEFEAKYKELNCMFDKRDELDINHYFVEVEKVKCEAQSDFDQFICESEERIAAYEAEIARIRALKPFEEMTCEEFCILCPEKATNFPCYGRPSFWPHDDEEQTPGPAGMPGVHAYKGEIFHGAKEAESSANPAAEASAPNQTETAKPKKPEKRSVNPKKKEK